ncbi:MAG TPA: pectate lyase [Bacteroidales bacterium]|nr:pectate lyase [Bacteroidales bacterium]HPF02706.1 pectate lyase [Bacteroidales bacterium]HPJ58536.1 pectate lyase [Bacteroidales bacterium]HPR11711.1 pectate lyase [Bacteroidales bacterium]HRW86461.1 pectate lyase [Bacteroidales bacterium]
MIRYSKKIICILFISILLCQQSFAQRKDLKNEVNQTMMKATRYMVETVSTNGGYVWFYLPDFSRRWGEMEAFKTMIWVQSPGTVSMGHLFLDAYRTTGDEYYYQAAEKTAAALIWGQSPEGGWNYMIDFAGDRSLKEWYNTIGKNGWRLEEFQYYYGNSTFDDDVTSNAARFLLRMYLEKLDPKWKPALDKAINFILESQYPCGGWPQRYPLKYEFSHHGNPDYTSFHTFNDGVIGENVNFLIQCYLLLGQQRLLDPIMRGMSFYIISQDSSGGWGQQLNMNLETVGARTYEPKALLPGATYENAMYCITWYRYTGNRKFLKPVPDAIKWLERSALPPTQTENGRYTHSTFVEMGTNRPVFVHRKGSNVKYGYYYHDYNDKQLLSHYGGKTRIQIDRLRQEYERVKALSPEEVTADSPLKIEKFKGEGTPRTYYDLNRSYFNIKPDENQIRNIISSLDKHNRWLAKHASISNPYAGDGKKQELTDEFASVNTGDETDTSPFRDTSDQDYISTGEYIRNMNMLISYLRSLNDK